MRFLAILLPLVGLLFGGAPVAADPPPRLWCTHDAGERRCIRADRFDADLCALIEGEARDRALPPGFLARLLWQESRFRPRAMSPAYAKGIAQFIDSTARLRGLSDPFDPAEAIFRSAEYLAEMRDRYGNLGLAAAGYNGGERRVERFMAREGGFARETIDYVAIITGVGVEAWRDAPPKALDLSLADGPFGPACLALASKRTLRPLARPAPPPPRFADWGAQVGYGKTQAQAEASVARLQRGCRGAGGGAELQWVPVAGRIRGRGDYVMARLGADTRRAAARLCESIRSAGCACAVFRNP